MIVNASGGGAGLNFKVVGGTTQPSNPKENTIWVETDTKIAGWNFSATEPPRRSSNKNLIVYPYQGKTETINGITWTDNGDGTVTANGTATAQSNFSCSTRLDDKFRLEVPAGAYFLSGAPEGCAIFYAFSYDRGQTAAGYASVGVDGNAITLTQDAYFGVTLVVDSGSTLNNAVFKPQLEKGSAATDFIKGDATGQVWIETGTASGVGFNALKKNSVMVYPLFAKQYVSGAWVVKTAKSYQGGEWVEWHKWVYHYGDDCEAITGGWLTYNYANGTSSNYNYTIGTCTNSESGFVLTTAELKSIARQTANPIDLTNVNTIEVYLIMSGVKNYSNTDVFVASADKTLSNGTFGARWRASSLLSSLTKVELDVSALTGFFYIGVGQSKWDSDPITTTVASIELV